MWQQRSGSVSQRRSGGSIGRKDCNCSPYRSTSRWRVSYVSGKSTRVSSSTIGTSSPSSLTMWISTDDCRCHEHVRHMRSPNCSCAQRSTSSALIDSTSGSWSAGAVAKQHLLQRVAAQAAPQRLERDHFLRRDVAEVDVGPELLDEPDLGGLRRRLEDDVLRADRESDLGDEIGAHPAGGVEDPRGAAFARLGDHLPGAGLELLLEPLHPPLGAVLDRRILRSDLRQNGEVAGELRDQLELALARDLHRPVGDLDVREPEVAQPRLVLVELARDVDDLEERPADHDGLFAQHVELAPQVARDCGCSPAELDDRDVVAARLEYVLPAAGAETLVDDVRQSVVWLKVEQRSPSVCPAPPPERRGRASCRARRCRR